MRLSSEYKSIGKKNLENNYSVAILVCLAVLFITFIGSIIPFFGAVIVFLISGQLTVGENNYFIKLHRKENAGVSTLFNNFQRDWLSNFVTYLLYLIYLGLWFMLFIIPGIIKFHSYTMTFYLKAKNPTLKSNEAITLSRKIMDGKKWKFCCFQFSFIGWIILSFLTFGIGFIFLAPYMQSSTIAFYEDAYNEYYKLSVVDNETNEETVIVEE